MRSIAAAAVTAVLVLGCRGVPPESVADSFWTAALAGDWPEASRYTTGEAEGLFPNQPEQEPDVLSFEVGEAEIDGESATVVTTLVVQAEDGQTLNLEFPTHMARQEGEWKVDLPRTSGKVMGAVMREAMRMMGEMFGTAMTEMTKGLAEGMAEGMKTMADSMEAAAKRQR